MKVYAGRETGVGAGMLPYCETTGRFLLMKRSEHCDYPNTWCGLGGGVEPGEALTEAVRREAWEEAQFPEDSPCDLRYIGQQDSEGFTFHSYFGLLANEFEPVLNEEHSAFMWVPYEDFPEEMHPKMMEALNTEEGQKLLNQHTVAFGRYN